MIARPPCRTFFHIWNQVMIQIRSDIMIRESKNMLRHCDTGNCFQLNGCSIAKADAIGKVLDATFADFAVGGTTHQQYPAHPVHTWISHLVQNKIPY